MKLYRLKKKNKYLQKTFNIDLRYESIKKKNWRRKKIQKFLLRADSDLAFKSKWFKEGQKKKKNFFKAYHSTMSFYNLAKYRFSNFNTYLRSWYIKKKFDYKKEIYKKKFKKFGIFVKTLQTLTEISSKHNFLINNLYFLKSNKSFFINNSNPLLGQKQEYNFKLRKTDRKNFLYYSRYFPTKKWQLKYWAFRKARKRVPWVRPINLKRFYRRKPKKWWVWQNKILKTIFLYYGFFSLKKLNFLKKNIFKKKLWSFSPNLYIEKTLLNLLWKLNFFRTFRQLYIFLKSTGILVNNQIIKNPYFYCAIFKKITFPTNKLKLKLISLFYNNLKNKQLFLTNFPEYFEFSLKSVSFILWREPKRSELNWFDANINLNLLPII